MSAFGWNHKQFHHFKETVDLAFVVLLEQNDFFTIRCHTVFIFLEMKELNKINVWGEINANIVFVTAW
jgi:hypothetical protein